MPIYHQVGEVKLVVRFPCHIPGDVRSRISKKSDLSTKTEDFKLLFVQDKDDYITD